MIWIVLIVLALPLSWWLWERSHRRTGPAPPGLQEQIDLPFEQEFELYHNAFSLCSKKVRICLAELGIDHASHHIDLIETGSYETLSRRFLAVNPQCTVPVLVHNGHPVYESHEQIRYAADHAGEQAEPLVPEDPNLAGEMQVWVDRASLTGDNPMEEARTSAGNCVPGLTVPLFCAMMVDIPFSRLVDGFLFHRERIRPMMFFAMKLVGLKGLSKLKPAVKAIRGSIREMNVHLDALEAKLDESGGPWILGEFFTLADVSWVVIFDRMREADCVDLFLGGDLCPKATAYRDRLFARSSYAKGIWNHEHPSVRLGTERIREAKRSDPRFRALFAGEKQANSPG